VEARRDEIAGVQGPFLRDDPAALAHAQARSMSERLGLALSWNAVAVELRAGLAKATDRAEPGT